MTTNNFFRKAAEQVNIEAKVGTRVMGNIKNYSEAIFSPGATLKSKTCEDLRAKMRAETQATTDFRHNKTSLRKPKGDDTSSINSEAAYRNGHNRSMSDLNEKNSSFNHDKAESDLLSQTYLHRSHNVLPRSNAVGLQKSVTKAIYDGSRAREDAMKEYFIVQAEKGRLQRPRSGNIQSQTQINKLNRKYRK